MRSLINTGDAGPIKPQRRNSDPIANTLTMKDDREMSPLCPSLSAMTL